MTRVRQSHLRFVENRDRTRVLLLSLLDSLEEDDKGLIKDVIKMVNRRTEKDLLTFARANGKSYLLDLPFQQRHHQVMTQRIHDELP